MAPRPGSERYEAQARGVTIYRVRQERAARGEGPKVGRIQWSQIMPEQVDSIRENVKRNYWRRTVDIILRNKRHYIDTGENITQYNYYEGLDIVFEKGWLKKGEDEEEDEYMEKVIKRYRWMRP